MPPTIYDDEALDLPEGPGAMYDQAYLLTSVEGPIADLLQQSRRRTARELETFSDDEEEDEQSEEPGAVTDELILQAYQDLIQNPITPEAVEQLRSRLAHLLEK